MTQTFARTGILFSILLLSSCSVLQQSPTPSAVQPIVPPAQLDDGTANTAAATAASPTEQTPTTTTDAGTTATPVGGGMTQTDQDKLSHALDGPLGQPTTWVSTSNGKTYTVVPTTKVTINGNPYCRKYNVKVEKGSQSSAYTGTACVSADSSWKVATESGI